MELSGNPSSEQPDQVIRQLHDLALRFESESFKKAFEALCPDLCPCCVQSLLDDAAVMLATTITAEAPADV